MSSELLAQVHQAMFAGCDGLVELRALPSRQRTFVPTASVDAVRRFCSNQEGDGCFWGVATRRSAGDGSLQNCRHLGALFVDIDHATISTPPAVPPSVIINSGRGKHLYWLLQEPFNLQQPDECAKARALLRSLAAAVGGDMAAAEPARILRIPESWNHKFNPARRVTVETCELHRRYSPTDFDTFRATSSSPAVVAAAPIEWSEPIREGQRNDAMFRLIRTLVAKRMPLSVIQATAEAVNLRALEPPLADAELRELLVHAIKHPSRARREIVVEIAR